MAFFGVTKEKMGRVWTHPNADRLSLAQVEGMSFQFVIGKDQFQTGEPCLYFPVDAILPLPLQTRMGLAGKLAGKNKDRIKTIRLRGEISQGIVGKISLIDGLTESDSDKITLFLGVTRYDPPILDQKTIELAPLRCGLTQYDIEGADRFTEVLSVLMDQPVAITEKMEGSNYSVSADTEGNVYVNQRNHSMRPKEGQPEHGWWKVSRESGLLDYVRDLQKKTPDKAVAVYGEMCGPGVQGNLYKLTALQPYLFDIKIGFEWVDYETFRSLIGGTRFAAVPELSKGVSLREWLNGRTIVQAASGRSALVDHLREGIVIRPMTEQRHLAIGRLLLKQRDPVYLSETEN